ncbi:trypsin-like serine protease [Aspergillus carlsbadensis]|nr:trypsin-like serine protease [Aspergillus carlsbadensis]
MKFPLILLSILPSALAGISKRIIGGNRESITNLPYQISLYVQGSFVGGGSIIAPNTILTAAHCVSGAAADTFTVRAGSSSRTSGGTLVKASSIAIHPKYGQPEVLENDLAIITLDQDLSLGPEVETIQLPAPGSPPPATGQQVIISGWGATVEGKAYSQGLQAVTVDIVDKGACESAYEGYTVPVTDGMFCAGVPAGGKGSCTGDSGGPVVADGVLVGIVSWELGCARQEYPGVYSNVAFYRDWINEVAGV